MVFKTVGLVGADENIGFYPQCPITLQECIIDNFTTWLKASGITAILFNSDDDASILIETFRQSFMLPSSHIVVIQKSIKLYESWFCQKRLPDLMRDDPQPFFRHF